MNEKAHQELKELDDRLYAHMLQFKDTPLDAMYRFWIGDMNWQEQIAEVQRVLTLKKVFPSLTVETPILNKHFKIVRFKY